MEREREHPTIIELDEPTPRGMRFVMALGLVILIALIVAPFVLDVNSNQDVERVPSNPARTGQSQVCRPTLNVPDALEDVAGFAMPSWMRLCNWFVEPVVSPPGNP
jgi:hypothetical protein